MKITNVGDIDQVVRVIGGTKTVKAGESITVANKNLRTDLDDPAVVQHYADRGVSFNGNVVETTQATNQKAIDEAKAKAEIKITEDADKAAAQKVIDDKVIADKKEADDAAAAELEEKQKAEQAEADRVAAEKADKKDGDDGDDNKRPGGNTANKGK